ncbi:MAG: DUF192 domain-containing protein [Devosiaceae bacterium]|nr:DUF192 domain-containing protein [Devosiaceae bacterium]
MLKIATKSILIFFALIFLAACTNQNSLTIITKDGAEHKFSIEIADTEEKRTKGLMFVQELAPNAGMLFDFQEERQVAFWMRNTFIPLDMLFIAANGEIKNIYVNARPQDPTAIPSDGPVRFVLEIAGGRSVELGIAKGDKLEHSLVED